MRLLRRIQKHILEEPRRFFMNGFGFTAKNEPDWFRLRFADASMEMPPCKTAACIAGTANLLTGCRRFGAHIRAARLIGVPTFEESRKNGVNNHPLFETNGWPYKFRYAYRDANTSEKRAKVAAARIEHLIKTGE